MDSCAAGFGDGVEATIGKQVDVAFTALPNVQFFRSHSEITTGAELRENVRALIKRASESVWQPREDSELAHSKGQRVAVFHWIHR